MTKSLLIFTALGLLLAGCGMSQEEGRQKLADLNVEYSKENFVDHAAEGDATVVDLFLKAGMSASGAEEALAKATEGGHAEVARRLMEAEVELGGAEQKGEMLITAVRSGSIEIVKMLLEAGADPNFVDDWGREVMTPLLLASGFVPDAKSREIVQLLLERGADPNYGVEEDDETALAVASLRGYPTIVNLLLEAGADPNMGMDHRWGTALHSASRRFRLDSNADADDRQEVVRLLLEAGADPNIENDRGKTALSYALKNDHEEVAQMLREAGAREVDEGENDRPERITEQTRARMANIRTALVDYERDSTSYPESLSLLLQHIRRDAILSTRQDSVFGGPINIDSLFYSPWSGKRFHYTVSDTGRVETYLLEDPDTDDKIGTLTGDPTRANAASWE